MARKNDNRFSLALKPRTMWAIKRLAEYRGISANTFISNIMDSVVEKHFDALQEVWDADEKAKSTFQNVDPAADIPAPDAQGTN